MRPVADWRLYLVTDGALASPGPLERLVEEAVLGGVGAVQLREKTAGTREFVARARRLLRLLRPQGIPLLVNDRVDVALAAGADGVHLGQEDMPVAEARHLLGPERLIGLSLESLEQLAEAEALDVAYYGVSPIFQTPTKTDTRGAWGLGGLAQLRLTTRRPLIAIGGLHADNVAEVVAAGADGVAVVSALCAARDPRAAAAELLRRIEAARQERCGGGRRPAGEEHRA